jgi:hypothetical protein
MMIKFGIWQTQLSDAVLLEIEQLSFVKVRLILFLIAKESERVLGIIDRKTLMIPNFIENAYPDIYNANTVLNSSIVEAKLVS